MAQVILNGNPQKIEGSNEQVELVVVSGSGAYNRKNGELVFTVTVEQGTAQFNAEGPVHTDNAPVHTAGETTEKVVITAKRNRGSVLWIELGYESTVFISY